MAEFSRRIFMGAAAGTAAVGVAMLEGQEAEAGYLGPRLRLNVRDLGVLADGTGDDGARLTAGLAKVIGTYDSVGPRKEPVEIDFGDLTLHLKSPIIINQNYIEFMGSPKFFCDVVQNAIVVNSGPRNANVFGCKIRGTLLGHIEGDGVLYQQGSQGAIDIRNEAYVGRAIVHLQGSYRNDIRVQSKGEGIMCYNVYKESVLNLAGALHNCINSNIFVVAYDSYGPAVVMQESQGFDLRGDIERSAGPGVDLYNCQNGIISIYTEKNGLEATNMGFDTPDDVRIRSGPGQTVQISDGNIIHESRIGGEALTIGGQRVMPNSVHVINAYRTYIEGNVIGGNITIEPGCVYTRVGLQSRIQGTVIDRGQYTTDQSVGGRTVYKAGAFTRLVIDGQGAGGALIGSDDSLLRLYGLSSFGTGTTLANNFTGVVQLSGSSTVARVNFGTPERDARYFPMVTLHDLSGASASSGCKVRDVSPSGFDIVLNAEPGIGQTIQAHYLIVRTG
jgi:hypothetical protein